MGHYNSDYGYEYEKAQRILCKERESKLELDRPAVYKSDLTDHDKIIIFAVLNAKFKGLI